MNYYAKGQRNDTTVIARIIDFDKVCYDNPINRYGREYYWGIKHFKIEVFDSESHLVLDTMVVSFLYNSFLNQKDCSSNFNLILNRVYIFELSEFTPAKAALTNLQGRIDSTGEFFPTSNDMIYKYNSIYNINYASIFIR
jgi:hypothetical protein